MRYSISTCEFTFRISSPSSTPLFYSSLSLAFFMILWDTFSVSTDLTPRVRSPLYPSSAISAFLIITAIVFSIIALHLILSPMSNLFILENLFFVWICIALWCLPLFVRRVWSVPFPFGTHNHILTPFPLISSFPIHIKGIVIHIATLILSAISHDHLLSPLLVAGTKSSASQNPVSFMTPKLMLSQQRVLQKRDWADF